LLDDRHLADLFAAEQRKSRTTARTGGWLGLAGVGTAILGGAAGAGFMSD
jgi:hypothetical protein